jgi:signal transduction histidine kinase
VDNGFGFRRLEKGTGSRIVDSLIEMLGAEFKLDTGAQGSKIRIALDA